MTLSISLQLMQDEKALQFTRDKPFENVEAAHLFLSQYDQYEKYGVGRLAVIEKATSKFIGWCGIRYCPAKDQYDIGFRFFQQYWNHGFVTETALKCVDVAFRQLQLPSIVGRAMKENVASIKVLEKIGMNFKEALKLISSKE